MEYIIMHENVVSHDAVGNDIEVMARVLTKAGKRCRVFAVSQKNSHVEYIEEAELKELLQQEDTVLIYHLSVAWDKGYKLIRDAKCRIIFRYHNITPPGFFKNYSAPHIVACEMGMKQVETFQKEFPNAYWICDSEFNARDIWRIPKEQVSVCAPFNKLEEWGSIQPDKNVLKELKSSNCVNILFVGRVVPNKGYFMLIESIRHYYQLYDKNIKLRIVGKPILPNYYEQLKNRIWESDLTGCVEFVGDITDATLAAYYKGSDIFVCCSEHEGFCVPIVEAQYFGLPVIAMRYSAVPETIGEEQVLVPYRAVDIAAAIHTVATREDYKKYLAERGRQNFDKRFSIRVLENRFLECLEKGTNCIDKLRNAKNVPREIIRENPRIAFVIPWFAEKAPGGAEMELRSTARKLHESGMDVEILTTRVQEYLADWSVNHFPEGTEYIWGIPVTRFSVRRRDAHAFGEVNVHLMNHERINEQEEDIFNQEMVNSPELIKYIRNNYDRYDLFVFIPYMFGTTFYGMRECYDKAVMIPCFHDEAYAYMKSFVREFSRAAAMIYNAYPEKELANQIYSLDNTKQIVMGIGMDTDITTNPDRFRTKYHINEPFLLYAGRKDQGKGVDELIEDFGRFIDSHGRNMKLVLIGGGSIDIPAKYRDNIIDLGFVDMQDKYDACGAALCLCQLSRNESFSLVIMESWLCHRPVMVHSACAVTKDFAERFEGGRAIGNYEEFEKTVEFYLEYPDEAARMGESGREHVVENFSWNKIVENYKTFFHEVISARREREESEHINIENTVQLIRWGLKDGESY